MLVAESNIKLDEVAKPEPEILPPPSSQLEKSADENSESPVAILEMTSDGAASGEPLAALATETGSPGHVVFSEALPRYDINPLPEYPEAALRRGQQGTVQLEVLVLTDGRVGGVNLVTSSGFKSLDREAQKAVRRWTFEPATSLGGVVESRVVIPVDFVLEKK